MECDILSTILGQSRFLLRGAARPRLPVLVVAYLVVFSRSSGVSPGSWLSLQSSNANSQRLRKVPNSPLLFPPTTMSASFGGSGAYLGCDYSLSQLLQAAKRKLRDATFGGRYVRVAIVARKNFSDVIPTGSPRPWVKPR